MIQFISDKWATAIKVAVVVALAALTLTCGMTLLIGGITWWEGEDKIAERWVAPWRFFIDHQPSPTLAALVGGSVLLLVFLRPMERVLENLKEGPFGLKTHDPVEKSTAPNPKKEGNDAD